MFQVDWFFSEDDLDDLSRLSVNLSLPTDSCEVEPMSNHNLLLNNIQKVEGICYIYNYISIISYAILLALFIFYAFTSSLISFFFSSLL